MSSPAKPVTSEARAQLDALLRKVIDRINQDPAKAAIVLTEWTAAAQPARATATASHPAYRKKAA